MKLTPALEKRYTADTLSAREAQRLAELVAFGPVVFQAARLLRQWGLLALMRESDDGLTVEEMARESSRPSYAVRVLCEAGLTAGLLLIHADTERYRLSKAGWFLLTDELTGVNMDFNHDVNYQGLFYLDQALSEGRPAVCRYSVSGPPSMRGCQNCRRRPGAVGSPSTISIPTTPLIRRCPSSLPAPHATSWTSAATRGAGHDAAWPTTRTCTSR